MDLSPSGLVNIFFPFDAVTHSKLRSIRPKGFWCSASRAWEFPFSSIDSLIEQLGSRFVIGDDLSEWLNWSKVPLPPLPSYQTLSENSNFNRPLMDGRIPFEHQCSGASWLLTKRRALLSDEMGLGKTLTALLAAKAIVEFVKINVIVIAPSIVHSHWKKEASAVGLSIALNSWASIPRNLPGEGSLVIVDEAHFAKSLSTKRSQAMLRLSRHPRLQIIWMLSGTPIKNGRPKELFPLLAAMDHPIAVNQSFYENNFCKSHLRNNSLSDNQGASNLEELQKSINTLMLNRCKKQILNLPEKSRKNHIVLLDSNAEKGFNHRLELVIDDYQDRAKRGLVRSEAEPLAVMTALRQITAEFKLPAVSKVLKGLIKKEESVLLFSCFIQPLEMLNVYLGGSLITGRQTLKERELSIAKFQAGQVPLLLATYGVAGLGLSLHKASNVVLLERPWTPGEVSQAEDRCHRIGMQKVLTSHWFQLGFADQLVDSIVASKAENIELIMRQKSVVLKRDTLPKMVSSFLQSI